MNINPSKSIPFVSVSITLLFLLLWIWLTSDWLRLFATETPRSLSCLSTIYTIGYPLQRMADGRIKDCVVISRDHHDVSGTDSPFRETSNIYDGSAFTAGKSHNLNPLPHNWMITSASPCTIPQRRGLFTNVIPIKFRDFISMIAVQVPE